MLHTHPVFVRRTMAALHKAGYARSTGGPGGGWTLALLQRMGKKRLSETARDVASSTLDKTAT
ncbi:Rrf2 family transcriptional regulator [Mycetohabitans sp. B5]|nr:Rrf2 family transcriptional regulator [Mycetohabitans sp. B5]